MYLQFAQQHKSKSKLDALHRGCLVMITWSQAWWCAQIILSSAFPVVLSRADMLMPECSQAEPARMLLCLGGPCPKGALD